MYDYCIVGAGLFGSVFAYEAGKRGKKCLVIEKRGHVGGNIFCETIEGVTVHKYGAHIFHTKDKQVWDYMNAFCEFNHYTHSVVANYNGELYNLPFNMNTFYKLYGVTTPHQAQDAIEQQRLKFDRDPRSLEEQALSTVGPVIYEKLIKGYTEKQWGRAASELPTFILKRIPLRFTYDNAYFGNEYQGIPGLGYNYIIECMLQKADVRLDTEFSFDEHSRAAKTLVFTGMLDEFYSFKFGALEYRSLKFETEVLDMPNYQGVAVMNYTSHETPYTRVIEHKHFEFGTQEKTVITKEYPLEWSIGKQPYYPVNDNANNELYLLYKHMADREKNVIFGGRLAYYKYYDMWRIVKKALEAWESI